MFDRPLKILLVSSEVVPFAKTGGLADVAGSLPKALATVGNDSLGNDVRVAMPRYRQIEGDTYKMDFPVPFNNRYETAIIRESSIEAHYRGERRTIPVYMVDNYHYFYRDRMYMFDDEAERFAFFCRALLEMLPKLEWQPDVIHCNDWQSGLIPLFLKTHYLQNEFYNRIATVFTIHNLQYQGNFPRDVLQVLGLGEEYFHPERLEFYGAVSFMKAGIVYADVINTVSRTYAAEIQHPELGERMDGLLRKRSADLYGIVNGINYHEFNPRTDPRIHRNFDQYSITNKKENKFALQRELELPVRDVPVIGLISRLVDQKGLDLIAEIIDEIMDGDIQLVVLGSGETYYEKMFETIKSRYPEKMGIYIGFNAILAQRIYAGADMFLMPSRFEPCGLGQLISLRYGTIPIVRFTGGLADTVSDYNPANGSGNGFGFTEYSSVKLLDALNKALQLYREQVNDWQKLVINAMELDFSWARSGVEYIHLFQEAMSKHLSIQRTA
ncbi:glycogen synthase GlgA [Pelotomaculum terephthalicicum JT]|uniref:glycogen synthase GlgA n=1 Tax=Pelotomaculum TaxID=191373 RepID=UPI0009D48854|nr:MULTISPECIES: glycogen synthase GlgA [Pelotomaculum]MCG9967732.1 glycogen synthase GlgA [Pelotomaculum terephthalicicum JT]OPX85350.1 MAG: Glycogen synthase [Pelotomaculum sp. PtaB.Bin117]OPY62717.1 MAG: Glycogen synthase [Pelotomaculum sp. PtaU1.Bin065]